MVILLAFLFIILGIVAGSKYYFTTHKTKTNDMPIITAQLSSYGATGDSSVTLPVQTFTAKIGEVIHLKNTASSYDFMNYSFEVVTANANEIFLKQVPDEMGKMNPNGKDIRFIRGSATHVGFSAPGRGHSWELKIK